MGTIVVRNQPCLDQIECCSSDARQIYENGTSHCFSCNKNFPSGNEEDFTPVIKAKYVSSTTKEEVEKFPIRGFKERTIRLATCEFFKVHVGYNSEGQIADHYYPYPNGYKHRKLPKTFSWVGSAGGLFGQELFPGGGKRVCITEGEIDAMSIAQAMFDKYQRWYPVVSLPSASGTKELLESREWLRTFDEVVLCLDNDKAGHEATEKAIKIIGIDKVKIWKPPEKDANDVLVKHGADRLNQCIWDAETYSPAGIIQKEDIWKQMAERKAVPSAPYPACLAGLNTKIKGKRLGEIALFISGTGAGKSTITREIVIDIVENSSDKVGIISLEESPGETGTKLSGMALNKNPEETELTEEELRAGFDKVFGSDQIVLLDHQGSIKDESIVEQLEYMCLMGCKYLIIDHITILVSEGADGLTGNEAIDKIMNDLLRLVKRHDVWVGLVSHLRKVMTGSKPFEQGRMPTLDDIRGCLAKDTGVIGEDGRRIAVQDVGIGTKLMGASGRPAEVVSLCRGTQQMYRVTMKRSHDFFVCNEDHILTLSYNDRMLDISVRDFLKTSDAYQTRCKQHYSTGYELEEQSLLIPPYAFGAWLGDGSKSAFRVMDASTLGIAARIANDLGATLLAPRDPKHEYFNFDTGSRGDLLGKLKELGVYCNKHIPDCYKYNSINNRLALLAGLLDTDGTFSERDGYFRFYQKDLKLASDVNYIAKSLGFFSTINAETIRCQYASNGSTIYCVSISGDIEDIPAFKTGSIKRSSDALKRGITIEKLDVQDYYGFTLDGDGRFLLDNHIITHNSGSIKQVSFDVIAFTRNSMAEDETIRNTIEMAVLKSRTVGKTGKVPGATYNQNTSRLTYTGDEAFDVL